jgi:DNA/RNA endonuclease G (NUC1)
VRWQSGDCGAARLDDKAQADGIWRLTMVCEARGDDASAAKYYRQAAAFIQNNEGFDEEGVADMTESAERLEREA